MNYYLDLFSPETYEAFTKSDRTTSGFRERHRQVAQRLKVGDRFLCYVTKIMRWVGVLEVCSPPFEDSSPIFYAEDDPFKVRFKVKPIVWLDLEYAIPIYEDSIWNELSFTCGQVKGTPTWTGKIRSSLAQFEAHDAELLENLLLNQAKLSVLYPLAENDRKKLAIHTVRRLDKDVAVIVPEETISDSEDPTHPTEIRESIKIQALLAEIGSLMGMKIWIPKADRGSVTSEWKGDQAALLDRLPLNYDDTTLRTIEQIDVLWLKGRSIRRAFEVEHTTSIYSGILRMADLQALQPNMDIRLHIVAPENRREKVFSEIRRPVFSLLDRGPLSENCTFLSYDAVRQLALEPRLTYLPDTILKEYEEFAED
jgi:hypothetical protein